MALRELGPPDLVHLVKQPIRGSGRQVRSSKALHCTAPELVHS